MFTCLTVFTMTICAYRVIAPPIKQSLRMSVRIAGDIGFITRKNVDFTNQ